jgi:phosphohistidine swiveling domain-containing protein
LAQQYIVPIRDARSNKEYGNKAQRLSLLAEKGHKVPPGFVVSIRAKQDHERDEKTTSKRLRDELSKALDPGARYAVRSSSNQEDAASHSYAGQFLTLLDQQGVDQVLDAIMRVWSSSSLEGRRDYAHRMGSDEGAIEMAVIVQEMVPQVCSGVAFSHNPLTGDEEEVIEAVRGSGEALVQDGATPMRWVVREGETISSPKDPPLERDAVLSISRNVRQISSEFGSPVDMEWVFDGKEVQWVQLRAITALAHVTVYSNTFSKEVLPGMIKPLVWSINIPLVNGAWVRFLVNLTGVKGLKVDELAKRFYYRAYFNMSAFDKVFERMGMPKDSLQQLTGMGGGTGKGFKVSPTPKMLVVTPNLVSFLLHHFTLSDKLEGFLPRKEEELRGLAAEDLSLLNEEALVQRVDDLTKRLEGAIYYNVVTPLASNLFNRMLESRMRKAGIDPASTDALKGTEGFRRYYPDQGLRSLHRSFVSLDADAQKRIRDGGHDALMSISEASELRSSFELFIHDFGHVSESGNDFSTKPWREDLDFVLALVMNYPDTETGARKGIDELDLGQSRRSVLAAHRRATKFALLKERTSSVYSYGYGLYRNYFLEMGRRFTARELLSAPEDVFFLSLDEVRQIVSGGCAGNTCNNYRLRAAMRKREMSELKDIDPPAIIFGEVAPPLAPKKHSELKGTPTSGGYYKGLARVVRSPAEFQRVQPGDVVVIPYSDVAWTPLFTKAGAVVAESGGMLSHASIVAREYGIPAVVSVEGAMRIPEGVEVVVDGYTGLVSLADEGKGEVAT